MSDERILRRTSSQVFLRRERERGRKEARFVQENSVHIPRSLSQPSFSNIHRRLSWWGDKPVRDRVRFTLTTRYAPKWKGYDWLKQRDVWHFGYDHQKSYWPTYVRSFARSQSARDAFYGRKDLGRVNWRGLPHLDPMYNYRKARPTVQYDKLAAFHPHSYLHQRTGQDVEFTSGFYTPYKYFYYYYYCL